MSKSHKHALTIFADPKVKSATPLDRLVVTAQELFATIPQLENEAARRAIQLGMVLQKLRHSAPHGSWERGLTQMLTSVNIWTPKTAKTNASYYMRIASFFVERMKVSVPEMLALPGDQTELALIQDPSAEAQRLNDKLGKFVGQNSLNELLIKFGIKGVQREEPGEPGTPEEKAQAARERVWESAWNSTQTLFETLTAEDKAHYLEDDMVDKLWEQVVEIQRALKARRDARKSASA